MLKKRLIRQTLHKSDFRYMIIFEDYDELLSCVHDLGKYFYFSFFAESFVYYVPKRYIINSLVTQSEVGYARNKEVSESQYTDE